jgi:hypothetical protein
VTSHHYHDLYVATIDAERHERATIAGGETRRSRCSPVDTRKCGRVGCHLCLLARRDGDTQSCECQCHHGRNDHHRHQQRRCLADGICVPTMLHNR